MKRGYEGNKEKDYFTCSDQMHPLQARDSEKLLLYLVSSSISVLVTKQRDEFSDPV